MAINGWKPSTWYDVLEAPRESSPADLKKARDLLINVWFADRFHGSKLFSAVSDRAALIHEAYAVLSDPQKRRAYDDTLPSPELEINAFPDALQRIPAIWKRMAAWMKDENVGEPFHRKMAFSAGDLLERRRQPTDKQRTHMLAAWKLAIDEGFDPEKEDE
jgi:DnaJ-class molecular chaperone